MNSVVIHVAVEGRTEQTFVRDVLAPVIASNGLYLYAAMIGRPGHKGGNIFFERAQRDICHFLKQREDSYVTTMFDYYGIDKNRPGKQKIMTLISGGSNLDTVDKAEIIEKATYHEIIEQCRVKEVEERFIPYIAMHEFEALLFSHPQLLAEYLGVSKRKIDQINQNFSTPEDINDDPKGAPSKRILALNKNYRKVAMGKMISESIGISDIRKACPHFDAWLRKLEGLPRRFSMSH